jgi:hypothetical protein
MDGNERGAGTGNRKSVVCGVVVDDHDLNRRVALMDDALQADVQRMCGVARRDHD